MQPILCVVFLFIFHVSYGISEFGFVNIGQGTVFGFKANDGEYFQFHGIPYADSTSGIHRFKAPRPPPLFQHVFIANRQDVKCVHALGVGYEGTEDCLVANVFTPTLNSSARLPVMVWIKGREFDKLNNDQEVTFKHLIEKDVVVVSLNFRESILGFLCLGTETAPGNAGLKDIIAGLRWIKENIEQFGGDSDRITLFGHGSGAAAVDLVTVSPMAEGLVHRVIAQSGTAIAPWAVTRDNLKYALKVAEGLGHNVTDLESLSQVFTRTSVAALMGIINELELTDNSLAFAPCLEREELNDGEPFLLKSPFETIRDGEHLKIPFLTGFVDYEGTIRVKEALQDNWLQRMDESFAEFLQPDIAFETEEQEKEASQDIRTFYFESNPINMANFNNYVTYHGDTMILVSAIREAVLRVSSSNTSMYLYQFSYKGVLGKPLETFPELDGTAHSEELAYLFHDNLTEELSDLVASEIIIERWTNFAKTGVPSRENETDWKPFTNNNRYYLKIANEDKEEGSGEDSYLDVGQTATEIELMNPHRETLTFWNSIYEEHFKDARSRWSLSGRDDDDDDLIIDGSGEGSGEGSGDGSGEGSGEEDEDDGKPDSASTAVAYTFSIVILFGILNQFHQSQIL